MTELAEIEAQIRDLQIKAGSLKDKLCQQNLEEFKKCEWLKEVELIFQENILVHCGTGYTLRFSSKNQLIKQIRGHVTLYGNSNNYQENIVISTDEWGYVLQTDSAETLSRFLWEFRPKIAKDDRFDKKLKMFSDIKRCMSD